MFAIGGTCLNDWKAEIFFLAFPLLCNSFLVSRRVLFYFILFSFTCSCLVCATLLCGGSHTLPTPLGAGEPGRCSHLAGQSAQTSGCCFQPPAPSEAVPAHDAEAGYTKNSSDNVALRCPKYTTTCHDWQEQYPTLHMLRPPFSRTDSPGGWNSRSKVCLCPASTSCEEEGILAVRLS